MACDTSIIRRSSDAPVRRVYAFCMARFAARNASMLNAPGPWPTSSNSPPMIARFFMNWII